MRTFIVLNVVLALLSMAAYFGMPSIGRDDNIEDYNAMRGVFATKNMLADSMVYAIACCIHRFMKDRKVRVFLVFSGLLFGCVLLSHSASALVVAAIMLALSGMSVLKGHLAWLRTVYVYFLFSFGAVLLATLILSPDLIFDAMGRDASLTGRVPLWQLVIENIGDRPFLGHGYAGFWSDDSRDVQDIWHQLQWFPPAAHNGFLDAMLDLGIPGLSLFLWIFVSRIWLSVRALRSGTLFSATWILLFLLIDVSLNLDESLLLAADAATVLLPIAMIEIGSWNDRRIKAATGVRSSQRSSEMAVERFITAAAFGDKPTFRGNGPRN